ncbi:MAG: hypothetical protein KUG77_29255 [Nannocystaceae bacterium]|nr:hypothetical protein [Nannocystaceae bacterium]
MTLLEGSGVPALVSRYGLVFACLLAACGSPSSAGSGAAGITGWETLVVPEAWTPTSPEDDPMAEHRPQPVLCGVQPWQPEGDGIEVETEGCNYVSLSQPLTRDLAEGDLIRLTAWWDRLASDPPATGHLAVLVDGEVLWEESVAIPGEADVRELEFESPLNAEAGTEVVFHLHNHGYNTWRLQTLQVALEDE